MILAVFKLRLLQFYRLLKEIGLVRIILISLIILFFSSMVFYNFVLPKNTIKSLIAIGLLLLIVHAYRKDKHFLKIVNKNPYPIYLSEYLLLTLPLLIIWLINNNWIGSGILMLIVFLIPLIRIKEILQYLGSNMMSVLNPLSSKLNSNFTVRLPFVSAISFEWISGIRRKLFIMAPVYLFFLAFSFRPFVAEVGLIFLSVLISGFYFYGESREFIELFAKNPRQFIWKKIFINFKQLFIVYTPILFISLIFQTSTWYFLIAALVISFLIQAFVIVFKYGLFEENANLNRNMIILLFLSLFVFQPYFLPVPFILAIRSYIKAIENLKPYFYDQN
jgi:hypothetical protein